MGKHTQRILDQRAYAKGQTRDYIDRKYPSPLYTELVARQHYAKDRTRDVRAFASYLKQAGAAARAGDCKEAAYALEVAEALGDQLIDRLPNVKREVNAKIRMVEREVLDRAHCGTRKR